MKRSWIGLFLLILLFAGSLLASHVMVTVHTDSAENLEQAAQFAMEGNWPAAAFLTAQAQSSWKRYDFLRAALANHSPSEEIDAHFAVLSIYGSAKDSVNFAALSRQIANKIHAIGDAHSLKFHNLL